MLIREQTTPLSFKGWKRRIILGSEVWLIFLGVRALDTVVVSLFAGPIEQILTSANGYISGRTVATSAWWIDGLMDSIIAYVFLALLAIYITKQRLSDLGPISQYWPILRNKYYLVFSAAIGIIYFHGDLVFQQSGLYMLRTIGPILVSWDMGQLYQIILVLWLSATFVIPALMTLYILGDAMRTVNSLRNYRKNLIDTTTQTRLSAFVPSSRGESPLSTADTTQETNLMQSTQVVADKQPIHSATENETTATDRRTES